MGLPHDVTLRVGDDEVGIVRGGKIDEFSPRGFVVEDGHEMRLFRGGNLLAYAVEDHGPDKTGSALEFGNLEIGDTRIAVVVGRNVPSSPFKPSIDTSRSPRVLRKRIRASLIAIRVNHVENEDFPSKSFK